VATLARRYIQNVPDVVLPVLDEADAIPLVLAAMPPGFRPIVVDNGSTDGSGSTARRLGADVVAEPVRGFGAACYAGLLAATADIVCFMDCDGSLDPADLARVVEPIELGGADLVVGERLPERGAWPVHARLANRAVAMRVRGRTGLALRDLGPMRAAPRAGLLTLDLRDRGFGWPLEMVLKAALAGWRVVGLPVPYAARTGRSKVTGTVRGTIVAVRDMARILA
jgi:glycosyltransferase involved in cell wall biosynthesis